ncbi:MAG: hypothetical protein WCE97_09400 [Candidatus Cybelea sp.]
MSVICGLSVILACVAQSNVPTSPAQAATPAPSPNLTDPCGGSSELLKKYLSASPCVFVRGQGSIQTTYAGTNTGVSFPHTVNGRSATTTVSSHAFGYPGAILNIGFTPTSQITVVLPTFSQVNNPQTGAVAGTADMEFSYKQLLYSNRKGGVLGGILATYQAPTGSPGLNAPGPTYELNPLLNIALNKSRSVAVNLSFPVANVSAQSASGANGRAWQVSPQAVVLWRSPGGTLLALVGQYAFSNNNAYLTINTAQLLSRSFQLQATYGGNSSLVDYVNPVEDIGRTTGNVYRRSFSVGFSYLIGRSEAPP